MSMFDISRFIKALVSQLTHSYRVVHEPTTLRPGP